MSSLNKVILIGRLGKDVDTRYMPSGECVASFSLATSEKWKDKQTGESKEQTEWHTITAFKKMAEICTQFLKKGSLIYCEGKLKTDKYIDKSGVEKYATKVIIDEMQMLTPKNTEGSQGRPQYQPQEYSSNQTNPTYKTQAISSSTDLDGDIPF